MYFPILVVIGIFERAKILRARVSSTPVEKAMTFGHGSKLWYRSPTRTVPRPYRSQCIGRLSVDTQNKMSKIFKNY